MHLKLQHCNLIPWRILFESLQIPTSLTLAAPPEKGILKKQGARSTETLPLKTLAIGSGEPSYCAISDSPYVASLESEYMAIGESQLKHQVIKFIYSYKLRRL